jgi:DNA-binding beta-propeller fold protein YncE
MRILRPVLWTIAACLVAGVLGAAFLIWGPSLRQPTAPAPHAIYVRSLGESGPGKLQQPIGVAVAASGEVFVSSSGDSRIVVFGPDGAFRRSFGREGDGPGELQRPMHLSIGPDGLLDVPEYLNDRISIFRQDGSFVSHLAPKGLDAPGAVVVAADGTIYVANFYHHEVSRFSSQGKPLESWGTPGRIGHGRLHYPTDLAFAPDGSLWVADAYNNRLQHFVNGQSTAVVGWDLGLRIFGFRVATGVAVDQLGRVYGADFGHGKVRIFDANGTPLDSFGSQGNGPGQFDRPESIAFHDNRIYVTDFGNHRLQEWKFSQPLQSP